MYRIGVDTGGTFTDFVVMNDLTSKTQVFKVPSTPEDPSRAIIEGFKIIQKQGADLGQVYFFCHGTTVGTNALLEEKGVETGLLITKGFRGIYEVMEQTRGYGEMVYNLYFQKPRQLASQYRTEEIEERLNYQGEVLAPLNEKQALEAVKRLRAKGVSSVAVCLLFSFLNPRHEERLKELIESVFPECSVSLSSEVLPQIREYYRLSTTVINAYLKPIMTHYIANLDDQLRWLGVKASQRYIMQSNGGVSTFRSAAEKSVTTILSGPAGGIIAATTISRMAGFPNIITFDMGGTSTDVAAVLDNMPIETFQGKVGGRDLCVPMLDINTVGAGGGTIAWLNQVGVLEVGPQSAGADPGPVCYRRGGSQPTVTDANLVLGYLNPGYFAGGAIELDMASAYRDIEQKIAEPLGLDPLQAAEGIIRIINVKMEEAIKAITTARGLDLRDFVLLAFGGGGPVHAGQVARDLGIPRVLIPLNPGVTSALGLLISDVRHDYVHSYLKPLERLTSQEVNDIFGRLREKALLEFAEEGYTLQQLKLIYYMDMRYAGQGYELNVESFPPPLDGEGLKAMAERFHARHASEHGHKTVGEPVEAVNFRLKALAKVNPPRFQTISPRGLDQDKARDGARAVYFNELQGKVDCPVFRRDLLDVGSELSGPAIVEQPDCTTVIYPGQVARIDDYGNMILEALNPS